MTPRTVTVGGSRMLVGRGRRAVMALLAGGLIGSSAACVDNTAGPETTGPATPSAATRPAAPPRSGPSETTPVTPATASTTPSAAVPSPKTARAPRPAAPSATAARITPQPTPTRTPTRTPTTEGTAAARFTASVSATTADDVRHTYRPGCPVSPSGLRTITMTYRNYEGQVRSGVLIVAAPRTATVVDIFRQAFNAGFRINRMDNPNVWNGDDKRMMAADNTSGFNCRRVTGNAAKLSPHSYGTAIDVNTRRNPYRAADTVWYPSNGARWIDRSLGDTGMIRSSSTITRSVLAAGGTWGGRWAYPDYQHFELD